MFKLFKRQDEEWPFDQPKNCAVFTLKQIMNREISILAVYHDLEDDGWQFVSNTELSMEDAMMVTLESVANLDPSVLGVANIKPGYHAWRASYGSPWTVAKTPEE